MTKKDINLILKLC